MALLTWQDRTSKGERTGPVLYLDFDATILEEYSRAAEVTQYPVENGSVLSDHYQPQPRAITLEVQVSDTPAAAPTTLDGKTNAAPAPGGRKFGKHLDLPPHTELVTGVTGTRIITANAERFPTKRTAIVLQFDGVVTRTVDVFIALDALISVGQLVDVLLFRDVEYKDMVITNIRTPRDAQSGSTLTFTIDLLQIAFADTENGGTPAPAAKKHRRRIDAGQRNGTDTNGDAIAFAKAAAAPRYP